MVRVALGLGKQPIKILRGNFLFFLTRLAKERRGEGHQNEFWKERNRSATTTKGTQRPAKCSKEARTIRGATHTLQRQEANQHTSKRKFRPKRTKRVHAKPGGKKPTKQQRHGGEKNPLLPCFFWRNEKRPIRPLQPGPNPANHQLRPQFPNSGTRTTFSQEGERIKN